MSSFRVELFLNSISGKAISQPESSTVENGGATFKFDMLRIEVDGVESIVAENGESFLIACHLANLSAIIGRRAKRMAPTQARAIMMD
jgi:hypothetical protein